MRPRRYAGLVALRASNATNIGVASVLNRAGAFVSPYVCPFPFTAAELPRSIASPKWSMLDLNATVRSDKYAIGGTIFLIAAQDLSTLGRGPSLLHAHICMHVCARLHWLITCLPEVLCIVLPCILAADLPPCAQRPPVLCDCQI